MLEKWLTTMNHISIIKNMLGIFCRRHMAAATARCEACKKKASFPKTFFRLCRVDITKCKPLGAVEAFGVEKALFPTGFVKFFAEYARFRLQNLP